MTDFVQSALLKASMDPNDYQSGAKKIETSSNSAADAAERLDVTTQKVGRSTTLTSQNFDKFQSSVDKAYRAEQQYQKAIEKLNAFHEAGIATGSRYTATQEAITQRYLSMKSANDNASQSVGVFSRLTGIANETLAAFGVTLGLAALVAFGKSVVDRAQNLHDLGEQLSTTAGFVEVFEDRVTASGGSTDIADNALRKFNQTVGDALNNDQKAVDSFKKLGVSVTDASGKIRPLTDDLQQLADHERTAGSNAQIAADLQSVMGRNVSALIPIFRAGGDGIKSMSDASAAANDNINTLAANAQSVENFFTRVKNAAINAGGSLLSFFDLDDAQTKLARYQVELNQAKRALASGQPDGEGAIVHWLFGNSEAEDRIKRLTQAIATLKAELPDAGSGSVQTATSTFLDDTIAKLKDQNTLRLQGNDTLARGNQEIQIANTYLEQQKKDQVSTLAQAKDALGTKFAVIDATIQEGQKIQANQLAAKKQADAYDHIKQTLSQYLSSLDQAADAAGKSATEREIESNTIKAAQIQEAQTGVLARNRVKTYAEAVAVLGDENATLVANKTIVQQINALTQEQTTQITAANAGLAVSADARALVTKNIEDELRLGIAVGDQYEKQRADLEAKNAQLQKINDATNYKDYIANLQDEVSLTGLATDERERQEAVLQQMHATHGLLKQDQADQVAGLIAARQQAQKLGEAIDGIDKADQDLATNILERNKQPLKAWADEVKSEYIQLLAWMAEKALISPIVVPVFESIVGSTLGLVSGGAAGTQNALGAVGSLTSGGTVTGASGFLGGVSTKISSATNWLTSGINALGAKLGFSSGTSFDGISTVGVTPSVTGQGGFAAPNIPGTSTALGSSTLAGTVGQAGIGYGLGNLAASILGGNKSSSQQMNGMIGAAAGAAIGSFVPVIGTLLGAALGGAIGGLIGPKESAHRATANFDANYALTGVTGTKLTSEGQQAASGAGQTIAQVAATLQSAGLTLTNNIQKLTISTARDKSFITTSSGDRIDVGPVGDAQAAVQGTLKYLFDGLKSGDKDVQQVINHYKALGGLTADNAQQFGDDLTFAQNLKTTTHQVTVQLGAAADDLAQVKTAYDADIERAKSLGLSTSQLLANEQKDIVAMQKATSAAYVALFQSATDSLKPAQSGYQTAAKQISDGLKQATSDMTALGGSMSAVTKAANAMKAQLASIFNDDLKTQLTNALSPVVGGFDQLAATWAQRTADARAVGGSTSLVSQLNTAEFQKYIVGLSDADRQVLISSGVMNSAQVALARSLGKVSDGIDGLIDTATAAAQSAQQTAEAWSSAQQTLDQSRKALLVSGPGVSPQNAYLAAQQQYADLLKKAQTDPQAASDFASFQSQFLQTSLAFNGGNPQYGSDFATSQKDLASLSALAGTQVTASDKLATQAQASVDALNAIKNELASGGPSITVLQQQLKVQQDLNNTMLAVLDQLGGHRAAGGSVTAGMSYLVGERGPEIFRAGAAGFIDPNGSAVPAYNANDNGTAAEISELRDEIRELKDILVAILTANGSSIEKAAAAVLKTGGDTAKGLKELKSEIAHATSVGVLHAKHKKTG